MNDNVSRLKWTLREGLIIGAIFLFWQAVSLLGSQGIANIGMQSADNAFTVVGATVASVASQVGFFSVVLYVLVRAGMVLVDYHRDQ